MSIQSYDPRAVEASPDAMPPWVALLAPVAELADTIANTEFVPSALRGRPAAIAAAVLYGYEIGVGPMQALRSIDIVQGRPTPSAELLRALIYQAGHEVWVVEATGTRVTVGGRRAGQAREHTVTWTSEMARAAGLTGKDSWKKYPRQMLMARATSELARSIFPDAIHGLGALDDVADMPIADVGTPTEAAANTVATMRRTRKRTAAIDAAPADAEPSIPSPPDDSAPVTAHDDDGAAGAATGYPASVTVNRDQLARMNIAFRELGVEDKDTRLRMASGVVGRRLTSSTELTKDEASKVITALDDSQSLGIPVPTWPDDQP